VTIALIAFEHRVIDVRVLNGSPFTRVHDSFNRQRARTTDGLRNSRKMAEMAGFCRTEGVPAC
jgi:hypothetical protein